MGRSLEGKRSPPFAYVRGWLAQDRENQFQNTPMPRYPCLGSWFEARINSQPPETTTDYQEYVELFEAPIISHEIGQWCAYPNFAEIEKYSGFMKAKNFEIFREGLAANHMGNQAHDFLMASGKLQALCYKEEIELALRNSGIWRLPAFGFTRFSGTRYGPGGCA